MFWLFKGRKEVGKLKDETRRAFEIVKQDIHKTSEWLKHLNSQDEALVGDVESIKDDLSTVREELEEIRHYIQFIVKGAIPRGNSKVFGQLSKQPVRVFNKQTAVEGVQTAVQTAVQSGLMDSLSSNERLIVLSLLNNDLKLSYDDLAAILGKERSTIRGQINSIKQKCNGLIEEKVEKNGKKRVYIRDEVKEMLLKSVKVRVKKKKKS